MSVYSFNEIDKIVAGQELAYESPFGTLRGYVTHVCPEHVSIWNGSGPWTITREHMEDGILTAPDVVE